jgi:hypothetical protein
MHYVHVSFPKKSLGLMYTVNSLYMFHYYYIMYTIYKWGGRAQPV